MASGYALMTANSFAGFAVETTYGASVAPTTYTPVMDPKVNPGIKWLKDSAFRGSPVLDYDEVQGVFQADYSFKTYCYTDTIPGLIRATLGSPDTVASVGSTTGTGGTFSAYSHVIGLNNSPNTGSQAPSYTIVNDSVDNTYVLTAGRMDTLSFSFQADAAVEVTANFKTNLPNIYGASITNNPTESTQHLIPAWNCAASIGGAAVSVVEQWNLDIKRSTTQIYTLGSQSSVQNFQGPCEASGKATFLVNLGQTYWSNALVRDQQQVILNLIDPFTGYGILFQGTTVQLMNPVISQSKNWIELELDFDYVANTTDTVTLGYSPIKVIATNGQATQY